MKKTHIVLFLFTCALTASAVIVIKKSPTLLISTIGMKEKELTYADPYVTFKTISEDNKDNLLVIDMRSAEDYKKGRFNNTVNVFFPYEKDREGEAAFVKKVEEEASKFKKVILLPYSSASTTGEDAARILQEAGMSNVFVMKIGWNELYNLPGLWVPEEYASTFTLDTLLDH